MTACGTKLTCHSERNVCHRGPVQTASGRRRIGRITHHYVSPQTSTDARVERKLTEIANSHEAQGMEA